MCELTASPWLTSTMTNAAHARGALAEELKATSGSVRGCHALHCHESPTSASKAGDHRVHHTAARCGQIGMLQLSLACAPAERHMQCTSTQTMPRMCSADESWSHDPERACTDMQSPLMIQNTQCASASRVLPNETQHGCHKKVCHEQHHTLCWSRPGTAERTDRLSRKPIAS